MFSYLSLRISVTCLSFVQTMGAKFAKSKDVVHALSQIQRRQYLCYGYLKSIEITNKLILPNDVKNLCILFIENLKIKSATDIKMEKDAEFRARKELVDKYCNTIQSQRHKICLLGAGAVGMSAIVIRFLKNEFKNEYDPTIEDSYNTFHQIDGVTHKLELLDTAGQEDFAALRHEWIRQNETFIIVYATHWKSTFEHAKDLLEEVHKLKDWDAFEYVLKTASNTKDDVWNPPAILVANKCDLPKDQWQVSNEEGKKLADKWGIPFIAVSAKTGVNVIQLFETLVRTTVHFKKQLEDYHKRK